MPRKRSQWIAWLGGMILLVLHFDFWRVQRAELYFGWLPEELAYRVTWLLLAWVYLLYFCAVVWRDEPEEGE